MNTTDTKTAIRLSILNGSLAMPRINSIRDTFGEQTSLNIDRMFTAMWKAYLAKGAETPINLPYWAREIRNPRAHNIALKILSDNSWITVNTKPTKNWSEAYINESKLLDYVTAEELAHIRLFRKFENYKLTNTEVDEQCAYTTNIRGNKSDIGHNQQGFMLAGKTQFQFDTAVMLTNHNDITKLINKGIDKMSIKFPAIRNDLANYGNVGQEILDSYIYENGTYNSGNRSSDPRGRDNAGYLSKIGNPVGFKIMRSLLVIPEEYRNVATARGCIAKYLFVAELVGYRSGTKAGKIAFGKKSYENRILHPESLDELPENIWLENTYKDLDGYHNDSGTYKWVYPIELDMSASVLGFLGLLLNHKPYMERTNMVGETLNDAWGHSVITNRPQFKSIMRQLYGSQATPEIMWNSMDIKYTAEEVLAFNHELTSGDMALANRFKDFIINNVNPTEEMSLNVWRHRNIKTTCNKFFNHGEKTITYSLFDTASNSVHRVHHTETVRLPDLKAFKRYFSTALIHGIDNQPMDTLCKEVYEQYQWVLPIHDASILCAEASPLARQTFATELENIYNNRNTILSDYFTSIGIGADKMQQWNELIKPLIVPLTEPFKCSTMVLK